jgi:hypothetical protein
MTTEKAATVQQLRDQYKILQDNLDRLLSACGNNKILIEQVGDDRQEALKNYIIAHNLILTQSETKVKQLSEVAAKSKAEIDQALDNLQNIKSAVHTISEAVKTVGIIVATL